MMGAKAYNVDIRELIKTLTELSKQHRYVDFEVEANDDELDSKLVLYPVINSNTPIHPSAIIDPTKDPDDLIRDLT